MNKAYFRGIPTRIEVNRLKETFPIDILKPPLIINYEEIADLIGSEYRTFRFRTVTNKWRKEMETEHGIIIGTETGVGFKILNDPQKLDLSIAKLRSSAVAARRSYTVSAFVDKKQLSEEKQKMLDHNIAKASAIMQTIRLKSKIELPEI